MTTVQLAISKQQIMQAIGNLSTDDLLSFAKDITILRAQRLAPSISRDETLLLEEIAASGLLEHEQQAMTQLSIQLEKGTLQEAARSQAAALITRFEEFNVKRLAAVSKLATLRGQSVEQVMDDLGLWNSNE